MIKVNAEVAFLEEKDLTLEAQRKLKDNPETKIDQYDIVDYNICNMYGIVIFNKLVLKSRW